MSATKVKNEKGNASNEALPVSSEVNSVLESKPLEISPEKPLGDSVKLTRKMAGVEIDIELMTKALNDAKSLAGDLQAMAEKSGLGRAIETINGGKLKVPTPAVLSDLASLGFLGSDKAKAKAKCEKTKALLSVLRGLETLGVIKR